MEQAYRSPASISVPGQSRVKRRSSLIPSSHTGNPLTPARAHHNPAQCPLRRHRNVVSLGTLTEPPPPQASSRWKMLGGSKRHLGRLGLKSAIQRAARRPGGIEPFPLTRPRRLRTANNPPKNSTYSYMNVQTYIQYPTMTVPLVLLGAAHVRGPPTHRHRPTGGLSGRTHRLHKRNGLLLSLASTSASLPIRHTPGELARSTQAT